MLVANITIYREQPGKLNWRGYVHPKFNIQDILQQVAFNFNLQKSSMYKVKVETTLIDGKFKFQVDPIK